MTELQIGPYTLKHQVQSISLQEQKGVSVAETTRTSKNLIISSGQSSSKAEVQLLFTGLQEINTDARKLIALFRCCPIISVRNEMLSTVWSPPPATEEPKNKKTDPDVELESISKKARYDAFIPVAMEQLVISSVPDLPFSIYVTITLTRVDVSYATSGDLLYAGKDVSDRYNDPSNAYWLTVWIDKLLNDQIIPSLTESDFNGTRFDWYGKDIIGANVDSRIPIKGISLDKDNPYLKVQSESSVIRNYFSYHNIIGKAYPSPQHMGVSARMHSFDLLSNEQGSDNKGAYEDFNIFKESADIVARSKTRENRILGWSVISPISKLLSRTPDKNNYSAVPPGGGIFVPLNVIQETTSEPFVKTIRLDLAENNADFFIENEVIMTEGGTDYNSLYQFYRDIVDREYIFRRNRSSIAYLTDNVSGASSNGIEAYKAYQLFWPIEDGTQIFKKSSTFGLLTKETLKATFLHPEFDTGEKLRIALDSTKLIAGQIATGNRQLPVWVRARINYEQVRALVFGPQSDDPELVLVYKLIDDYVRTKLFFNGTVSITQLKPYKGSVDIPLDGENLIEISEEVLNEISHNIFTSFLGGFGSAFDVTEDSGELIQKLAWTGARLGDQFTDALFKVIVERSRPVQFAVPAWSTDAVHLSFFKLITEYSAFANLHPALASPSIKTTDTDIQRKKRRSLYPDLMLPTYGELYGDMWEKYSPTFSDFGIINTNPKTVLSSEDPQRVPAVTADDYVSPGAWFYSKKFKTGLAGLLGYVESDASIAASVGETLQMSLPFDTDEIEEIEAILKERKTGKDSRIKSESLVTIIRQAFRRHALNDIEAFNSDMRSLSIAASEKFHETYMMPDSNKIAIFASNTNNYVVKRRLSVGGLGAELYRVASEYKLLEPSAKLPRLDTGEQYKSSDGSSEFEFVRHLSDNTQSTIKSMVDQLPDTHESMVKLFPACKIYLIEKRGTDLVGDDTFFSVNPITSIDITLDKDEVDLAVITIADPLYLLQRDYFPADNIRTVKGENGNIVSKKVLGSLAADNMDGYLKRFKIVQGRAIQIKMGHDSNPENLKTVFTGRIAEIQPGDQLVIVAQGWKAELVSKQVSFYNPNAINWGAKDLAVQTIVAASPDGFGDYYTSRNANFILKNITNIDAQELARQVSRVQTNVETEHGSRSMIMAGINSIITYLGSASLEKSNVGLDTRLKNIWYPDIPEGYGNLLGLRSIFNTLPSQVNDSWVVPMQPAWEVLKEAARHTWNYVVQVVPYDGFATIFFGHPDQPYYFTKGNSVAREKYTKYINKLNNRTNNAVQKIVAGFKSSKFFDSSTNDESKINIKNRLYAIHKHYDYRNQDVSSLASILYDPNSIYELYRLLPKSSKAVIEKYEEFRPNQIDPLDPCYKTLEKIITQDFGSYNETTNAIARGIDTSSLPKEAYLSLKKYHLKHRTATIIAKLFYNIEELELATIWPKADSDIEALIGPSPSIDVLKGISPVNVGSNSKEKEFLNDIIGYSNHLKQRGFSLTIESQGGIANSRKQKYVDFSNFLELEAQKIIQKVSRTTDTQFVSFIEKFNFIVDQLISDRISLQSKIKDTNYTFNDNKYDEELALQIKHIESLSKLIEELSSFINTNVSTSSFNIVTPTSGLNAASDINRVKLKCFVYYLNEYIKSTPEAKEATKEIESLTVPLPPTMQTFRVHHNIDSDHDIIKNSIVASTRDMWNSVVIEHPATDAASSKAKNEDSLYNSSEFYSGIKWVYFPKQEVTGVLGLQFHPGLTLANKKLKIFTEVNCQGGELAAKLACNRLAEGIKKMYRGTLLINGRHIKPYDRIILNDDYTNMIGPIEVESVVHHWSLDTGWVSNIVPEAVCEANPGASILQTAAMEAMFGKVFKVIDFAVDVATVLTIVATLGGGVGLSAGSFSIKEGIKGAISKLGKEGVRKYAAGRVMALGNNLKNVGIQIGTDIGNPFNLLRLLIQKYASGPATSLLLTHTTKGLGKQLTNSIMKMTICPAYAISAQKAEQLPVILNPLIFNGIPFLAGLETDDPIWSIYFNDMFWSFRELQKGAAAVLEELNLGSFSSFK